MPLLFSFSLFLGAFLLFCVQPMLAKMVLPMLGGTPQVWNTCVLFFQAVLLGGYAYVYLLTRKLSVRAQIGLHLTLVVVALAVLPVAVSKDLTPPTTTNPIPWLLGQLTLWIGLPYFALSATAPLLQSWYSKAGEKRSADPYFLYSASNAGSLLGLLMYPLVIERFSALSAQSQGWYWGYIVFVGVMGVCGVWSLLPARATGEGKDEGTTRPHPTPLPPSAGEGKNVRWQWLLFSFVPSSWMLSITTYLTTDIAAIPLFWVIPLSLYLVTFIWAFSGWFGEREYKAVIRWLPVALLPLVYTMVFNVTGSMRILLPLHVLAFFLGALYCHKRLADLRPAASRLSEYYLVIAAGGALGGIFNTILAPQLFSMVLEYPLIIVVACALLPKQSKEGDPSRLKKDILYPVLLSGAVWMAIQVIEPPWILGVAIMICVRFIRNPLRLSLAVAGLFMVSLLRDTSNKVLYRERTFFGVYHVAYSKDREYRQFFHGTTLHGFQAVRPQLSRYPMGYYHYESPVAQVFRAYANTPLNREVAVVGLGVGVLAYYGHPQGHWTFYEIDPAVERVARNQKLFTHLKDSPVAFDVLIGDARLSMRQARPAAYTAIIVDAFGSDAIPVHLLTKEALDLYLSKLKPGGLLLYHITNRHLDLVPVLASLSKEAGLVTLRQKIQHAEVDEKGVKMISHWVVMAREAGDLMPLAQDKRWAPLPQDSKTRVWTDDYSNILSVLK